MAAKTMTRGISIIARKRTAEEIFGAAGQAQFITTASSPENLPSLHGLPEVIVTGRANVGKSTLLNAVLGRKSLLRTSKKPGRTQTLNFFRVGREPGHLVVVDAPGYGSRGRPEWGNLFTQYVENRTTLRRVYVLLNAKHGVTETDSAMLRALGEQSLASSGLKFTLQAIITKTDDLPRNSAPDVIPIMQRKIFAAAPTCLPAIITAALLKPPFGIEDVRKSIADACGLLSS